MKKLSFKKSLIALSIVASAASLITTIACQPTHPAEPTVIDAQSIINSLPTKIRVNSTNNEFDELKEKLKNLGTDVQASFLNLLDSSDKNKFETTLTNDYKISKIVLVTADTANTSLSIYLTVSKDKDLKTKTIEITDLKQTLVTKSEPDPATSAQSIIDSLPNEIQTNNENLEIDNVKEKLKNIDGDLQESFLNLLSEQDKKKFKSSIKDGYKISKITLLETGNSNTSLFINLSVAKSEDEKAKTIKIINLKQSSTSNLEPTPDPRTGTIDTENQSLKIATWNLLNYSGNEKQEVRSEIFANIIYKNKFDIISAQEINPVDGKVIADDTLVKILNELDPDKDWKAVESEKSISKDSTQSGQVEYYVILYKSKKVEVTDFIKIYDDQGWKGTHLPNDDKTYYYARPPFAAQFKTLGEIENTFTLVSSHLDSPGVNSKRHEVSAKLKSSKSKKTVQGNQEVEEALQLANVLKSLDLEDSINNEIIFMGDTNIATGNEAVSFKTLIDDGYANLLEDSEEDATSLSNENGKYANPYDKIFYKGNLKVSSAQKLDIWNLVGDDKLFTLSKWNEYKSRQDKIRGKKYSAEEHYVKSMISDHAPVSFILHLNKDDESLTKEGTLPLLTKEQVKEMAKKTV
ncbi:endonuclease/exonuclease/phosphatase family protein [Mycoplasmopsis agassizii]|uniref:endonuclease/exonuclease/phosphatase family protein n=1 Tax=Mycoplasmopsis agassizii TaxID=33922 RepID=UPI0035276EB9